MVYIFGRHGSLGVLIKMALYTAPNITDGFDNALVGMNSAIPLFFPMLLTFVFGLVFFGGFISQRKRDGTADAPMWATVASLSTLMVALPMTITKGILGVETLSIIVVITILSGFWLFTSRSRNEV